MVSGNNKCKKAKVIKGNINRNLYTQNNNNNECIEKWEQYCIAIKLRDISDDQRNSVAQNHSNNNNYNRNNYVLKHS